MRPSAYTFTCTQARLVASIDGQPVRLSDLACRLQLVIAPVVAQQYIPLSFSFVHWTVSHIESRNSLASRKRITSMASTSAPGSLLELHMLGTGTSGCIVSFWKTSITWRSLATRLTSDFPSISPCTPYASITPSHARPVDTEHTERVAHHRLHHTPWRRRLCMLLGSFEARRKEECAKEHERNATRQARWC